MKKIISLFLSVIMLLTMIMANITTYAAYDSIGTAKIAAFNTKYSGVLSSSDRQDFYKISIGSSGRVIINATHYDNREDAEYYLYDSSGNWIYTYYHDIDYNNALGYAKGNIVLYLLAGTYYFKTYASDSGQFGKYDLYLTYTNSNESFIDSTNNDKYIGGANSISFNTVYYGQLGIKDDTDFYKFTLPFSTTVTLNATHYNQGSDAEYYLYDDSGNWINTYYHEISYNSSRGYATGTIDIPLTKGIYYFKTYSDGSDSYGFYNFSLKINITKPSTLKLSSRKTTSLGLTWSKVGDVDGYQLQRKSGDTWKTLTNTTSNSYTVSSLKSGTKYDFRVRSYIDVDGTKYYSSWKTLSTPTKPSTPSIKAPSTNKKHQIIVKWNKVSAGTGYQVQYSKKKNFSSVIATKTVSGISKTSYTGKNFTKGKTYYVRVRAYKTVDGTKYYGSWSKVKSVKCK